MGDICYKNYVERKRSIDDLLDISNSWVDRFVVKVQNSGLALSDRDKSNLYFGAEMMVYCYKDMERTVEKAYAFQHPLAINDLLLDAYNGIYRREYMGKTQSNKIIPPAEFISCFRDNYLEIFHTSFFHDAKELGIFPLEGIRNFYDGLKMDGKKIAHNVGFMSLPKAADSSIISSHMKVLRRHPIPLYCKIGDAMHNSETKGSERQFYKMTEHYNKLIKENFRPLYQYFFSNIYKNYHGKVAQKTERSHELPASIINCLVTT
jgi:hypothetical protein